MYSILFDLCHRLYSIKLKANKRKMKFLESFPTNMQSFCQYFSVSVQTTLSEWVKCLLDFHIIHYSCLKVEITFSLRDLMLHLYEPILWSKYVETKTDTMLSVTHASKLFVSFSVYFEEKGRKCHRFQTVQTFAIVCVRKFFHWHFLFCVSSHSNIFWSLFNEASNGKTQSHIQQIWMTEFNWKRKHLKVNWKRREFYSSFIRSSLAFFERAISNSKATQS